MTAKKSQRKRANPLKKQSLLEPKSVKIGIAIIFIVVIAVGAVYLYSGNINEDNGSDANGNGVDVNGDGNGVAGNPIAIIDTSMGTIKVELYEDKVPITVENFVKLANDGFYNGMIFYRISEKFMIQAGRYFPDGSEAQSPYGRIEFETHDDVKHVDGAISMASTSAKVGGSAEFFICDGAQPFLDDNYAAFGVVVEGIEVVRDIASQPHDNSNPAGGGKPYTDIIINSITVENQ